MASKKSMGPENDPAFEDELFWCQEYLELKLLQKLSFKQTLLLQQALKTLKSSKSSYIKKRQVMRNTCGNYRKDMEEEMKASEKRLENIKLEKDDYPAYSKIVRIKKSTNKEHSEESHSNLFQFNFPEPETE
ncbi:hypothetical protein CDAR_479921 [Caerostris darwini]|uniref:Uncharacterized protein n=1 Tax=Caerostris darwini TaxID=1538125 RepID=A0AAV4T8P3_9ARAC|nr:hypothetical protein CDAR_479921 [Caerostris darwini]